MEQGAYSQLKQAIFAASGRSDQGAHRRLRWLSPRAAFVASTASARWSSGGCLAGFTPPCLRSTCGPQQYAGEPGSPDWLEPFTSCGPAMFRVRTGGVQGRQLQATKLKLKLATQIKPQC